MHEVGVANAVLEAVSAELRRGEHASRVGLRIGEFAAVDPQSLRFCFEAIVKSTAMPPLELSIEWCRVEDGFFGDELQIAYVEIAEAPV